MSAGPELIGYRDNLHQTLANVQKIHSLVDSAANAVAQAKIPVDAVSNFRDDAHDLASTIDSMQFAAKLMEKAGPLKIVARVLLTVLNAAESVVDKVESKAAALESKLQNSQVYQKLTLIEAKLGVADQNLTATEDFLTDAADTADTMVAVFTVTHPETDPIADAIEALAIAPNAALGGINALYSSASTAAMNLTGLFPSVNLKPVLDLGADLRGIVNSLASFSNPLNELYKILKPIEGLLDLIGFLFDITVGPVIDFVFKALGIDRLIDSLAASVTALLPDPAVFDIFDDLIDGALPDIDFLSGATDLFGIGEFTDRIATEVFGPVFSNPLSSPVQAGDAGDESLAGADGRDDFIDGRDGHDTLFGGTGEDVLIGGRGDDDLHGGGGTGDRAYFFGEVEEYAVSRDSATGQTLVEHIRPAFAARSDGFDLLDGVEYVVFNQTTYLLDDLFANLIAAQTGDTVIRARPGRDSILVGLPNEALTMLGNTGDDRIVAGRGTQADILFGGDGDDYLDGGGGDDTFEGGAGIDTVAFRRSQFAVALDLEAGTHGDFSAQNGRARSIENAIGSSAIDALFGSSFANTLLGEAGGDLIDGRRGTDRIGGGDHDDLLIGGAGRDHVEGEAGNDVLVGGRGAAGVSDEYYGGTGLDTLTYSARIGPLLPAWSARIEAQTPNLALVIKVAQGTVTHLDTTGAVVTKDSFAEIETIEGSDRADRIYGGAGVSQLRGAGGNDLIDIKDGSGAVWGGDGDDTIVVGDRLANFYGGDPFSGDTGTGDTLDLTVARDIDWRITDNDGFGSIALRLQKDPNAVFPFVIWDASGFERFTFGAGHDSYYGTVSTARILSFGAGDDFANASFSGAQTLADSRVTMGAGDDDLNLFGAVRASLGSGNDTVLYQDLSGLGATGTVIGGSGDDTVFLKFGTVAIDGGDGEDWLRVEPNGGAGFVDIDLLAGTIRGEIGPSFPDSIGGTVVGIEKVNGTAGADAIAGDQLGNQLLGADGGDTLTGRGGADALYGGTGDDSVYGGSGNDFLNGGSGFDVLNGGDGFDTVSWSYFGVAGTIDAASFGNLDVDLQNGTAILAWTGGTQVDSLANIENVNGGTGNDTISGNGAENGLSGGAGDDTLYGLGGDDVLSAGEGIDRAYGGHGNDTINAGWGRLIASGGSEFDTLNLGGRAGSITIDLATGDIAGKVLVEAPVWRDTGTTEARTILGTVYTPEDVLEADPIWHDDIGDVSRSVPADPALEIAQVPRNHNLTGRAAEFERIFGGAADLTVTLSANAETITGGALAFDILSFAGETRGISGDLATGVFSGALAAGDKYARIDGIVGSRFDDRLRGDDGDNLLNGSGGDNTLWGQDGDDRFTAGTGANTFYGGEGDDLFALRDGAASVAGGSGHDRVEMGSAGQDVASVTVIDLLTNANSGWFGAGKSFAGIEEVALLHVTGAFLRGTQGDDVLEVSGIDKTVSGRGGDDVLAISGGVVLYTLNGGSGEDTFDFSALAPGLRVVLDTGAVTGTTFGTIALIEHVAAGSGDDRIIGDALGNSIAGNGGNDVLFGGAGLDTLQGGDGDDLLFGGYARDTLGGGAADDRLTGDEGGDIFAFASGDGDDIVTDFENGADRIGIAGGFRFADLSITRAGAATLVAFDDVTITLLGTQAATITAADFLFMP